MNELNTWGLIRAILFLRICSAKNRILMRLRRLRQPKYLAGTIVGAIYMGWLFGFQLIKSLVPGGPPRQDVVAAAFGNGLELFGALVVFVLVAAAWIFMSSRATLAFSEPEIAFLFPAPISRRLLVRYKILSSQSAILFSSIILCLLTGRFAMDRHAGIRVVGMWLILTGLALHRYGASFTIQRVFERGLATWKYRMGVIVFLFAAVATVWWTVRNATAGQRLDLDSPGAALESLKHMVDSGFSQGVLWPFRALVRPALAPDWWAFSLRFGPALVILTTLFVWVDRSDVAFEEASIRASERVATRMKEFRNRRHGFTPPPTRRRTPLFELQPEGPTWVAFAWASLIAAGVTRRKALIFAGIGMALAIAGLPGLLRAVGEPVPEQGFRSALFLVACTSAVLAIPIGSMRISQGIRQHLAMADWVKTYPLTGSSVLLGQFLGPTVTIVVALAICGLVALTTASGMAASATGSGLELHPLPWVMAGFSMLIPVIWLLASTPVASVLLFPAWTGSSQNRAVGLEATGQQLIVMLAQVLMLVIVLLPAAAVALVLGGGLYAIGWATAAVAVAAIAGGITLWLEAFVVVALLGRLYDRFDPGEILSGS